MTKFTAYYSLCPIHDPKEFLGISPDRNEGNIITTLNKNIVIIIKISTQKQIRSWSATEKLSTKVVFDALSQRYVGVFGYRALRCWDESCTDVNKCKKLKFKKSIADLVVVNNHTYVLYSDGSCEILAKAIESRKNQTNEASPSLSLPTTPRLFDAKAFHLPNGQEVITYFERQNPDSGELSLVCLNIQDGCDTKAMRFKVARPRQPDYEVKPNGFAVVESENGLMLMTIWSDNAVFMLKLDESTESKSGAGKFVARMSALRVDSPMRVLGISRNFVTIYGANNGQEGASLLLYNTKFQVIKTKQFFKVYLDFSRLWTVEQYILIAMGQNLSVVSYSKSPDLISDLLGTQANNNFENCIDCDHINEDEPLQENIRYVDSEMVDTPMEHKSDNETPVSMDDSKKFADGCKIPFEGIDDFDHCLSMLSRLEMSTEIVEVENALEDVHIALMSDCSDTGFITPEIESIAQQLENCGASECEITEKLLTLLLKTDLLADIVVCLTRYTNTSDKMLVKVLKYALDQYSATKINNSKDIENSLSSKIPENICKVMYAVFASKFHSDSIAAHLRNEIDYDSVVILIDYLYNLLENCDDAKFCTRPSPKGSINDVIQFELQLLNWLGVLLSSHFQKLALSKDAILVELLCKWRELCDNYQHLFGELTDTLALLHNTVSKKKELQQRTSVWYSVEEVCLW